MAPAGVPEQPERGGHDDDECPPPAVAVEGELDGGRRRRTGCRGRRRGGRAAAGPSPRRSQVRSRRSSASRAPMPQATDPKSAIWNGKSRSSQEGPRKRIGRIAASASHSPDPPPHVDEEQADAEQEERDRDELERPRRVHPEGADPDLVDQDRGGEQVLDEGIEEGPDAPGAAVEQEVPLVAPEGQPPEPVEQQDPGGDHRGYGEQRGRVLARPAPDPGHQLGSAADRDQVQALGERLIAQLEVARADGRRPPGPRPPGAWRAAGHRAAAAPFAARAAGA